METDEKEDKARNVRILFSSLSGVFTGAFKSSNSFKHINDRMGIFNSMRRG